MPKFKLQSDFKPTGDQPGAINKLTTGLQGDKKFQTLLGVTGSGKTFTMANIIAKTQRPTLIISHNKTLTAQLASEFQEFFPQNEVHYFVSYYDYYQPEAYVAKSDTYIEKETQINEEIERLRHAATQSLLTRNDVIIVASVSCIYGLGNPIDYHNISITLEKGKTYKRQQLMRQLITMLFERNDVDFTRGRFRVKGEVLEIFPSLSLDNFYRLTFFGDDLEKIESVHHITHETNGTFDSLAIYPASHYFAPPEKTGDVVTHIRNELKERIQFYKKHDKVLEAARIEQRVTFDTEMMETIGYVNGIENYSRYFDGRKKGEPPFTLLDYFSHAATLRGEDPNSWLMFIDESHITIPQVRAMYAGDQSRKQNLVDFGFRLPSALDNRPLKFEEFETKIPQLIFVSATPGSYEQEHTKQIAEQVIRPTGLLDPEITIKPTENQIQDLIQEIETQIAKQQRVLVTTLTKRLSEEITDYLLERDIKVQYLHSEIDTLERLEILQKLRQGEYDVVVGINLLREGLDLPEVSLVAILDADKEGFLRSETSLIQTMGRAARHAEGRVIMYADTVTRSMKAAIDETERRREKQIAYNTKHNITPKTITKAIKDNYLKGLQKKDKDLPVLNVSDIPKDERKRLIEELEDQMDLAAQNLEFEKAAKLRDRIEELKK
ncbi:MAG: excinuclease ABC subunit UvrB [Patescibacteria group bacterium]